MKILIEIPESVYEHAMESSEDSIDESKAMSAIRKGAPIKDDGICDLCKCQTLGFMAVCYHCCAELKED